MADTEVKKAGRGRPPKATTAKKEDSKEVEVASKRTIKETNGDGSPAVKRGRGRPPKSGKKKTTPAVGTKKSTEGRGRGRPKQKKNTESEEDNQEENNDDDGGSS